jgi:hypothetical protein
MATDSDQVDTEPQPQLIRTLSEFDCAQFHAGWTLLKDANPGLAFALALTLPWRTNGYLDLYEDLDKRLSADHEHMCRMAGLPIHSTTLRILESFDSQWWKDFCDADEARGAIGLLRGLLTFDPDAPSLLLREQKVTPDHVIELATGFSTRWLTREYWEKHDDLRRWMCSILFKADQIPLSEWFFRLPLSRRQWLTRTFWNLHGSKSEDFETTIVERMVFPRRPHIAAFRSEEHALAYAIRLREARGRVRKASNGLARVLPWPQAPLPASGNIVPIRSAAELRLSGEVVGEGLHRSILLGQLYLYRTIAPMRYTIVLKWAGDQGQGIVGWYVADVWPPDGEKVSRKVRDQVRRWFNRQPKALRGRSGKTPLVQALREWIGHRTTRRHIAS